MHGWRSLCGPARYPAYKIRRLHVVVQRLACEGHARLSDVRAKVLQDRESSALVVDAPFVVLKTLPLKRDQMLIDGRQASIAEIELEGRFQLQAHVIETIMTRELEPCMFVISGRVPYYCTAAVFRFLFGSGPMLQTSRVFQ